MNEKIRIGITVLASHILLIVSLVILAASIRRDAFLLVSISQSVLVILYFSGYWEFFGQRFRQIGSMSLEIVIIGILTWRLSLGPWAFNTGLTVVLAAIQVYLLVQFVNIIRVIVEKREDAVEIAFPLKNGSYLVTDGGNSRISRLMNYHYYSPLHKKNRTNASMKYATDIVKIPESPKRFLPEKNAEYSIFGNDVFSPIDGIVFKVIDGIPDNEPFSGNYPYNTREVHHRKCRLESHLFYGYAAGRSRFRWHIGRLLF